MRGLGLIDSFDVFKNHRIFFLCILVYNFEPRYQVLVTWKNDSEVLASVLMC